MTNLQAGVKISGRAARRASGQEDQAYFGAQTSNQAKLPPVFARVVDFRRYRLENRDPGQGRSVTKYVGRWAHLREHARSRRWRFPRGSTSSGYNISGHPAQISSEPSALSLTNLTSDICFICFFAWHRSPNSQHQSRLVRDAKFAKSVLGN